MKKVAILITGVTLAAVLLVLPMDNSVDTSMEVSEPQETASSPADVVTSAKIVHETVVGGNVGGIIDELRDSLLPDEDKGIIDRLRDFRRRLTRRVIPDDLITTAKIADGAVTTAKIAGGAVTTVKIADDAITSAKILNATILTEDIAENAVTSAKLADNIAVDNLYADNVNIATRLTIPEDALADNTIVSADIKDNTIDNIDISTGFIQSGCVGLAIPFTSTGSENYENTISFVPSFSAIPVVVISDNTDLSVRVSIKDITPDNFTVISYETDNLTTAYSLELYWIAMLPKQD